jgi:DNA-binding beta-propeller fold protein YncE
VKLNPLLKSIGLVAVAFTLVACSSSDSGTVGKLGAGACSGYAVPQPANLTYANTGRALSPIGKLTSVGDFPTGGKLSPNGGYFWSISSGHGQNDVRIVSVASGEVIQTLPLPGAYGQVAFSPDGQTAYVSGEPMGAYSGAKTTSMVGLNGDVIHVFNIKADGTATESPTPLVIPTESIKTGVARSTYTAGAGKFNGTNGLPSWTNGLPTWPVGLAVSPNARYLVAALQMGDAAIIFDLTNNTKEVVSVGKYPAGVAIDSTGTNAYVSNAYDGTVSKFALATAAPSAKTTITITGLAGAAGDNNSQPQGLLQDPSKALLYVAVSNKDTVAVIDENTNKVVQVINMQRKEGVFGSQPISLAITPDGATLLSANAGENAIVAVNLSATNPSVAQYAIVGKIPTTDYPTAVDVTPDGCQLVWNSTRGKGTGANGGQVADPAKVYSTWVTTPDGFVSTTTGFSTGGYVMDLLTGIVGVTPMPGAPLYPTLTALVDNNMLPSNFVAPPSSTPIHGALASTSGSFKSYFPSNQIKYVFYIVKENRTYDQIFGSDLRGNGDPTLQIFGDNCTGTCNSADKLTANGVGPRNGVTPNLHALSRQFSLLDNFFENSEVSVDGHVITSAAYATNYLLKSTHADYSGRQRPVSEEGIFPVTFPPKYFLWDQLVNQNISFFNYGELDGNPLTGFETSRSATPSSFGAAVVNANKILASSNFAVPSGTPIPDLSAYGISKKPAGSTYASNIYNGCILGPNDPIALGVAAQITKATGGALNAGNAYLASPLCAYDSYTSSASIAGFKLAALGANGPLSRMDAFKASFQAQTSNCTSSNADNPASCGAPQLNYLIMMSDHTYGVSPGARDPYGSVADNDLAVGQFVELISKSPIWPYTAIFVVEDDSQDGADHVDAHRAPAFVISPYAALNGSLVHTRYDQYSVLRTIELILGLSPLSTHDALATPMYDAFTNTPNNATYTAITPQRPIFAYVPYPGDTPNVAKSNITDELKQMMALSKTLPWNKADSIPGEITDRILYAYAKSQGLNTANYKGPGPNASAYERQRANRVYDIYASTKSMPFIAEKAIRLYLTATAKDKD